MQVVHYRTKSGVDPVQDWLDSLKDRRVRAAALRRIDRAALGNFGDHKPCREGVMEMRLDIGPGFRLYYFRHGDDLVVLLCAGDKDSQDADIKKAIEFRKDYLRRMNEEEAP